MNALQTIPLFFSLLLLTAGACFAQVQGIDPSALNQEGACVVTVPDGRAVPNATVNFGTVYVVGSGFHVHEALLFPHGDPKRSWPRFLMASGDQKTDSATTGADGCTPDRPLQLPGIAGSYGVTYTAPGIPGEVVNYDAYIRGLDLYLNTGQNAPFHNDLTHPGWSYALTPFVSDSVNQASLYYRDSLSGVLLGHSEKIDILRGSLPWGGLSDNDPYELPGQWHTAEWEQHAQGTEVDVVNPDYGSSTETRFVGITAAMLRFRCPTGLYEPNTFTPATLEFWHAQSYVHYSCRNSVQRTSPPPHR